MSLAHEIHQLGIAPLHGEGQGGPVAATEAEGRVNVGPHVEECLQPGDVSPSVSIL